MNKFNETLKQKMEELKYQQKELAKEIGVNRTQFHRWNTHTYSPNFSSLVGLADSLICSIDELVGREYNGGFSAEYLNLDFSTILKLKRKELGISQRQLAKKLNTTQCNVHYWENGRFRPNIIDLISLADIFGCSIDELVGRRNYKTTKRRAIC